MKKVLIVATVVKMHIMVFHIPYLEWFKKNGYEVHVCASNDYDNKEDCKIPSCDQYYDLPFERSPFKLGNIKVYKDLKDIIDINDYDIIHCHTPMGGVLTRLAARNARRNGTKIIYTAHGFHFFKGGPIINWLAYYPIERWLARYTDILITINKEDYARANKSFQAGKVEYIPGVGIDIDKFRKTKVNKEFKRKELGLPEDAFVILSVGELNKNKNHEVVIKALSKLKNPKIYYIVCGQGELLNYLKGLKKELGMDKQVKLLGFRSDIAEICKASDAFIFPSKREGLGLAALEAMASGLPIITSNVHGIVDYSINEVSGYNCSPEDVNSFADAINKLSNDSNLKVCMGNNNFNSVKEFDLEKIRAKLVKIYEQNCTK